MKGLPSEILIFVVLRSKFEKVEILLMLQTKFCLKIDNYSGVTLEWIAVDSINISYSELLWLEFDYFQHQRHALYRSCFHKHHPQSHIITH